MERQNFQHSPFAMPAVPQNTIYMTVGGIPKMYYILSPEEMTELMNKAQANSTVSAPVTVNPSPQITKEEDEYMTRERVAQILHVDKSTLWRWDKEGKLVTHKVGDRRVLYKTEEVYDYINKNK